MTEKVELDIYKKYQNGVMLTCRQVEHLFEVTPTTIHNWRKKSQFPFHHLNAPGLKKPPCRFYLKEVLYWAERNNVRVVNEYVPFE